MGVTHPGLPALAVMLGVVVAAAARAQTPPLPDAAERRIALEKLTVVGSALYVGAHPDDENGAMLAFLAKGRKVRAAYLSLTRGDGGQNLIGTEQGELLGVLRTEELLAARCVDGAEQFFTRAVDFGYSKTAEETLRIWGHDAVLADVVWVIRSFRPDVIITRFPADAEGGHGHHIASAILAGEAFSAAADPSRFPEQLAFVKPWQATRLVWNAWRRPGEPPAAGGKARLTIDLGAYDPLLGRSWGEIAAASRAMHKSQGGAIPARRGSLPNDFVMVAGRPFTSDLFDGVDLTWRRIPGGETVGRLLGEAVTRYSDERPAAIVPPLLEALKALDGLEPGPWVEFKRTELLEVIKDCAGLWLEAAAEGPTAVPGGDLVVKASALNRSDVALSLLRTSLALTGQRESLPTAGASPEAGAAPAPPTPLRENDSQVRTLTATLPRDLPVSQPYWLEGPHGNGVYAVPDQRLVGQPHSPPPAVATFIIGAGAEQLEYRVPVTYRWVDPVVGERTRTVAIVPRATVNLEAPVLVFPGAGAKVVRATVAAHAPETTAAIVARVPAGWRVEPAEVPVRLAKDGAETTVDFTVTPPTVEGGGELALLVRTDRSEAARSLVTVDHPHIPPQTLLPLAAAKLVRVDVPRAVRKVGYVMGAGDEIPAVLRQLGFDVTLLSDDDLANGDLRTYDAIVTGVRAYNTRPVLAQAEERLLAYAEGGGTLIVQYNTERGLVTDRLGPYPLTIGHERTTDETAPVSVLAPASPVLKRPEAIGAADWEGWVQERGLNYAATWDPRYQALLAMADPGEQPTRGALLIADYGKGIYIYTGLAFFRQLPAGIPGAIRLFVNLLAGGRPRG